MKPPPPAAMPDAPTLALAEENLAAGRLIVRNKCPYYVPALLSFVPHIVPGLGTIGSTKNFVLSYDPAFIASVSPEETAGLLVHEILHIWDAHFDRLGDREPGRANRAMDRAINPSILEAGFKLPKGGCMPKDIGMPDNLVWEEYYDKTPPDEEGGGGAGTGHCGGCAGNPLPGEPDVDDKNAGGRSEAEVARTFRQVAEGVRDAAAKSAGKMPGSWARRADDFLKPARIQWQDQLAYSTRNAMAYRDGATTHRYDFPSRRQSGLGYGPGVPILPRMRDEVPDVFVAIDTSGSMGEKELTDCLVETQGIMKATGADVRLCVIDAEVHGLAMVKSIAEAAAMLKGGGGTDFRPAFQAAMSARPRPSLIVFLTDGYGPAPEAELIPTIWVYVGSMVRKAAPWGVHIRVPTEDGNDTIEDDGDV